MRQSFFERLLGWLGNYKFLLPIYSIVFCIGAYFFSRYGFYDFIFPFFVILVNFFLGQLIFFQNTQSISNRTFGASTLCYAGWAFSIYFFIISNSSANIDLSLKLIYIVGTLTINFLFYFSLVFPERRVNLNIIQS